MRSVCVPDGPPFEFNTRITPVAFAMQKPFFCRGIAQLVEQWSPKPRAEGSNPSAPATYAAMAQSAERVLGKDEVGGSNPPSSSKENTHKPRC